MQIETVEAVIFDLDGTLVHTGPAYRYIVVGNTLKTSGITTPNEVIDDFWFLSEDDRTRIIQEKWHLSPESQFWPTFSIYDTIDLRKQYTEVYGDAGILNFLKERRKKTGIVSAAPDHIIELETAMLNHPFEAVIRAQLVKGLRPKPSPDGLEKCLGILQVAKQNAIYVGNSRDDMDMARNAGVYAIRIDRGEYSFGKIEADLTIDSLKALRVFV